MGHGLGAPGKGVSFKHAHRSVPENGFGILNRLRKEFDGGRPNIHAVPSFGNFLNGHNFRFGTRLQAGRDHAIHGQIDFHPAFQGVSMNAFGECNHFLFKQGLTDFKTRGLEKRKRHAATDDDFVDFFPQVFDDADFSRHFGPA